MNEADKTIIENFHQKAIAEFGTGHLGAVGWVSNESQQVRFGVLAQLGNFNGMTVLDAGCGHADLFPYLLKLYNGIHYIGMDQLPVLLNVAIQRYGHMPEAHFVQADFAGATAPAADFVIACGSLNYFNSDPRYIYKTIEHLFAHSRMGFGFNLLSSLQYPDPAIVSYDPGTVYAFCKTLSPASKLITGYRDHDFTIFMYH